MKGSGIRMRYERELNIVFKKLIEMCRLVEEAIKNATDALLTRDRAKAEEVIKNDKVINGYERDIEKDCLNLLLLEQPVASDFRDVSATLKMITDLERIGDQATDISQLMLQFDPNTEYIKELKDLPIMSKLAIAMVHDSVQSYINRDLQLALGLHKRDDKVDDLFDAIKDELVVLIRKDAKNADQAVLLMMIAKYFEKIGDHAVNVGNWVAYALTGERQGKGNK